MSKAMSFCSISSSVSSCPNQPIPTPPTFLADAKSLYYLTQTLVLTLTWD